MKKNPFYGMSAGAMLFGCYMVNHALRLEPGHVGKLLTLMGVLQVYEALLLGLGAHLVVTRRAPRDGLTVLMLGTLFLLDATLQEPNGNVIFFGSPMSSTGGMLDVDSNVACTTSRANPIENIFWPTGRAPRGQFIYWVDHFGCGPSSSFTLQVLRGTSVVATQGGSLGPGRESARFSFVF